MGFLGFNTKSALAAQEAGADRIELCDDMTVGGITPTLESFLTIKEKVTIPVFIMIRPRGGDFVYSTTEFEHMKRDLRLFQKAGASGFVFGILTSEKTIDTLRNAELVRLAKSLPCTIHRAFDEVTDLENAAADAIACGFKTILTSGGATNACSGVKHLKKLVISAGGDVLIMPGGGVRSSNIQMLLGETKADWYHSSAVTEKSTKDCDTFEVRKLLNVLRDKEH
jgi:copper homeostasis protein